MSDGPVQHWHRRHHKPGRQMSDAIAHAAATAGTAPKFSLQAPDDDDNALLSGGISALLHAAVVGALMTVAALAPEVVEEIVTEVKIVKELPGSNTPARPAPRALSRPMEALQAREVSQIKPEEAKMSAQAAELERLREARAPRELDRTRAESKQVEEHRVDPEMQAKVEVTDFEPIAVDRSKLRAPTVAIAAPREIEAGATVDISAPQAFERLDSSRAVEYSDTADSSAQLQASAVETTSTFADVGIQFDAEDGGLGHGSTGVDGGDAGTVPCFESGFVQRYLQQVRDRTYARWALPPGTTDGAQVTLRFRIDASGSVTDVTADPTADPQLGASAVQALRSASPFPAMNDANRCLHDQKLRSIFRAGL